MFLFFEKSFKIVQQTFARVIKFKISTEICYFNFKTADGSLTLLYNIFYLLHEIKVFTHLRVFIFIIYLNSNHDMMHCAEFLLKRTMCPLNRLIRVFKN